MKRERVDWGADNFRLSQFGKDHRLTLREVQVVYGAGHGYTNSTIGRELGISEDTVKTHMRRVYSLLEAADRAHAVKMLALLGLFA